MKINKKTPVFQSGGLSVASNTNQRQATEIHLGDLDARDGCSGFNPFFHDEVSVPKAVSLSRQYINWIEQDIEAFDIELDGRVIILYPGE